MSSRPSHAPFQPTRWTLIAEANGPDRQAARAALEKLCAAYWYPLYAYVRRRGRGPEDAEDAVQGFFLRLVERDYFAAAARERGRLRAFLIHQMDCWLADASRRRTAAKRGGGLTLRMDDAEMRYAAEPATEETPETLYHRRWALTLLAEAMHDLEESCAAAGQAESFARLKPALTESTATALDTAAVAAALNIPRDQVRVRVHRLRAQFREALLARVAATLHTARRSELEAEMRELMAALRGQSAAGA
jgi:RNA polymerase sigma factor (sigma-70 family)